MSLVHSFFPIPARKIKGMLSKPSSRSTGFLKTPDRSIAVKQWCYEDCCKEDLSYSNGIGYL